MFLNPLPREQPQLADRPLRKLSSLTSRSVPHRHRQRHRRSDGGRSRSSSSINAQPKIFVPADSMLVGYYRSAANVRRHGRKGISNPKFTGVRGHTPSNGHAHHAPQESRHLVFLMRQTRWPPLESPRSTPQNMKPLKLRMIARSKTNTSPRTRHPGWVPGWGIRQRGSSVPRSAPWHRTDLAALEGSRSG